MNVGQGHRGACVLNEVANTDRPRGIVTGAAGGLGRVLAERLARDGWHLVLADVDRAGADQTLAAVRQAGGDGESVSLDVTDLAQWQHLRQRLQAAWPRLDLLVHCAGVCGAGEVGDYAIENWRWLLEINLMGVVHGCHVLLPWMKQNPGRPHIINMGSVAAYVSGPSMGAYNVSKSGVVALTETMFTELHGSRVNVSVVCPGFVRTELLQRGRFSSQGHQDLAQSLMDRSRLSTVAVAEEVVRTIGRRKLYVVPGTQARRFWWLKRFIPQRMLTAIGRRYTPALREAVQAAGSDATEPAIPTSQRIDGSQSPRPTESSPAHASKPSEIPSDGPDHR